MTDEAKVELDERARMRLWRASKVLSLMSHGLSFESAMARIGIKTRYRDYERVVSVAIDALGRNHISNAVKQQFVRDVLKPLMDEGTELI